MSVSKTLKRLAILLATAAGIGLSPASGAGTTPLSLVQQFDSTGAPLIGCLLNFYVAGTVATRQNIFSDFGLTTPLPNPLQCDSTGRVPQHWLADGLTHIRLTDSQGLVYVDTTMQVLGPSSGGGGGGGTVDPTTIMATGDEKIRYGTGPLSGWVRENGLTIGNAVSGATERANADTQALFVYLYNIDPNLVVSGGRTGNALNDYNANKTIATPDMRGRVSAGLDTMGAAGANRLTSSWFGTGTVLGASGGIEFNALSNQNQLPQVVPAGSVTLNSLLLASNISSAGGGGTNNITTGAFSASSNMAFSLVSSSLTFTGTPFGSASPSGFRTVQPTMLKTFYIKL
jgi:hypothetical protein